MRLSFPALTVSALVLSACSSASPEQAKAPSPPERPTRALANEQGEPSALRTEAPAASSAGPSCGLRPVCGAPLPTPTPGSFVHSTSAIFSTLGRARHRGRDLFLRPTDPQWVLAKFAYGPEDKDLEDENVQVYVLRDCGSVWEKAGTFRTTKEGSHAEVLGVSDEGGQLYVDLAKALPSGPLGVGRHRVRLVVEGDGSGVDLFLEVLPDDARIALSDIDGTLTESENAVVWDVLTDDKAAAHPGAADVMEALSKRGYYLFYLTARPHWLEPQTRKWLTMRGFPPGIVHTSLTATGRLGAQAAAFKTGELDLLKRSTGLAPSIAFGNMPSDVLAYSNAGVPVSNAFFYKLEGDAKGGVVHDDYEKLLPRVASLAKACR